MVHTSLALRASFSWQCIASTRLLLSGWFEVVVVWEMPSFLQRMSQKLEVNRDQNSFFYKFVGVGRVHDHTSHFPPDLILYVNLAAMGTKF